jgi:hypothetical protein
MSDQVFRTVLSVAAGLAFVGLFGYSVFGHRGLPFTGQATSASQQTRPPRVMYYDDDVDVYSRRSVRSPGVRGGGIRGGK